MTTYHKIKGDIEEVRRFIIDVGPFKYILEYPEYPENNRDYCLYEEVNGETLCFNGDIKLIERVTDDEDGYEVVELKIEDYNYQLKEGEEFLEMSMV